MPLLRCANNPVKKLNFQIAKRPVMQPDPRTNLSNELAHTQSNRTLEPDDKREITITFRVSTAEKLRLEQRCNGVVQSDYIRARLFDYPLPQPKLTIPEVNRQAIYELKKIGNNLNQQTKAINEAVKIGRQPLTSSVKDYLKNLQELTEVLEQMHQKLATPSSE